MMTNRYDELKVKDLLFSSMEEKKRALKEACRFDVPESVYVFSLNQFDREMGLRPLFFCQSLLNKNIDVITDIPGIELYTLGSGDKQKDIYTDFQMIYILPKKLKHPFEGAGIQKKCYYYQAKIHISIKMCSYKDETDINVEFIYIPSDLEDHYRWEQVALRVSRQKGFLVKNGRYYKPYRIDNDEMCRLANRAYNSLIESIVTSLAEAINAPLLWTIGEEIPDIKELFFPSISLNEVAMYGCVGDAISNIIGDSSCIDYNQLPFNAAYLLSLIVKYCSESKDLYDYNIKDLFRLLHRFSIYPPEKTTQWELLKAFFLDYYTNKDKRFSKELAEELFKAFLEKGHLLRLDISYDEI